MKKPAKFTHEDDLMMPMFKAIKQNGGEIAESEVHKQLPEMVQLTYADMLKIPKRDDGCKYYQWTLGYTIARAYRAGLIYKPDGGRVLRLTDNGRTFMRMK